MLTNILSIPYQDGDRRKFSRMCLTWQELNCSVNELSRDEVMRLLRYLMETRPNNHTYLCRVVARFNALNKLKVEDLKNEIERRSCGTKVKDGD